MTVVYADAPDLSVPDFIDVLQRSGLAERRPVDDLARVAQMLEHADLIVVARATDADGRIVGVARSVTDFAYCCYCSDLAVDAAYQSRGVGKALIEATRRRLQPGCQFHLISAPAAEGYYEKLGMERLARAFVWPKSD